MASLQVGVARLYRLHDEQINAGPGESRADPRSHVVISGRGSKAIRAVVKISRLCFIRTEIRNLREVDFPHLFGASLAGLKKVRWVSPRACEAATAAERIFCVSSSTNSLGTTCSKMISVPGASAATVRNVPKIASAERYMVTPSHEKGPGASVR